VTRSEYETVLPLSARGGRRPGAGRKPKGAEPELPHVARPCLSRHHPVHVTLRVRAHVWSLRSQRGMAVVESALRGAALRPGFRVARFSVQGNHVHLVVEAATASALTSGMKALAIRLARGMNRLMGSRGPVLEDRYHAHVLRTRPRCAWRSPTSLTTSRATREGEEKLCPTASGTRSDPGSAQTSLPCRRPGSSGGR
jgi:REP element-mobilizing transposase RayT